LCQLIRVDREAADPQAARNLSSFVTTWMEPAGREVVARSLHVNLADVVQYPAHADMHAQCVRMLANLFHAPQPEPRGDAAAALMGTATVGSSEGALLGALALKLRWRAARRAAGLSAATPNLVLGHEAHLALEKFCALFDVAPRFVGVSPERRVMQPEEAVAAVDEHTIGVIATLGSTYTGQFEDVPALASALAALNAARGWDVGIHVDAASGGFIAPFTRPQLAWDFRAPGVRSINVSGHK
jgi:glutamate decarboxylase